MLGFLFWLAVVILLISFLNRRRTQRENQGSTTSEDINRDQEWLTYLASFRDAVKTKSEKHLLETLIEGKAATELYSVSPLKSADVNIAQPTQSIDSVPTPDLPSEPKVPVDNTVLLLYFGAFLLVASAGLFAGFSKTTGTVRTVILILVAMLLYVFGIWLVKSKPKLKEVGTSLVGTALIIAPLIGLVFYNIVEDQENGAVIWLVTSLLCLALYFHAYINIKNTLISYLIIGSFVSTVQSSILTIELPTYVFSWGLVGCGLLLQFILILRKSRSSQYVPGPTEISAQLLVPLSIFTSLIMLPSHGNIQLGVTLILSGLYYGFTAWDSSSKDAKKGYFTASQLALISGASNLLFVATDSFMILGLSLSGLCMIYGLIFLSINRTNSQRYNLMLIGSLLASGGVALTTPEPWALFGSLVVAAIYSLIVWLKTKAEIAYHIPLLILIVLPFILGQYIYNINTLDQLLLCAVSAAAVAITTFIATQKNPSNLIGSTEQIYLLSLLPVILLAFSAGFLATFLVSLIAAASFVALQYSTRYTVWWPIAAATTMIPGAFSLIENGIDHRYFAWSVFVSLALTLIISLKTRNYFTRWIVVINILATPLAIGGGALGFTWEETGYSIGYTLAMIGCLLARSIARGRLITSTEVPISSYYREASQAYVFGYIAAAIVALITSLNSENSRLLTTSILVLITSLLIGIVYKVESNSKVVLLVPVLVQLTLFSAMRPSYDDSLEMGAIPIMSATIGAFIYWISVSGIKLDKYLTNYLPKMSLAVCFVGPIFTVYSTEHHFLMPISLAIAGCVAIYHTRSQEQIQKELSVGVIGVAILWELYLNDINNIHIHTHIVALFLAGFAAWRYANKDKEGYELYQAAAFCTVTIPLVLAALYGNGIQYAYLLIVEQVAFMTLGVIIHSKFLQKAGLFTGLGVVLYLLRDLGWAFLAVLAVVIITIAIIRLQRNNDDS